MIRARISSKATRSGKCWPGARSASPSGQYIMVGRFPGRRSGGHCKSCVFDGAVVGLWRNSVRLCHKLRSMGAVNFTHPRAWH